MKAMKIPEQSEYFHGGMRVASGEGRGRHRFTSRPSLFLYNLSAKTFHFAPGNNKGPEMELKHFQTWLKLQVSKRLELRSSWNKNVNVSRISNYDLYIPFWLLTELVSFMHRGKAAPGIFLFLSAENCKCNVKCWELAGEVHSRFWNIL